MNNIIVNEMKAADASQVLKIYADSIIRDDATYKKECPDWKEWDNEHNKLCRLVARDNEKVIGFVAVSDVFVNSGYKGVGELSIYVDYNYRKQGIGSELLKHIIQKNEQLYRDGEDVYYTLQARIFTNNVASIALHKKLGFRLIGMREKILKKDGIWRDVYVYERRSPIY